MVLKTPEWLPEKVVKWGVPKRVTVLMRERAFNPDANHKLTMFDVGGPAVRWAWIAFGAFWSIHILFPFVVFKVSSCPSHAGKPLEATTPWWIWLLAVASVLLAVCAALRSFMFVVVMLLQWLNHFTLPLLQPPFPVWLLFTTTLSIVTCLSTASTGAFVGSAWRRRTCGDSLDQNELRAQWAEQTHERWHWTIKLVDAMLGATFATMVLRVLFSALLALPKRAFCSCIIDFGFQSEKDGYRVPMGWKMWHADVLKVLTDATNMAFFSKPLSEKQCERAKDRREPDPARCLQILLQQIRREVSMYFLNAVLSAVQLAIQSVLFACGRAVFHALPNPGTSGDDISKGAIALGFLSAVINVCGGCGQLLSIWEVARSVNWDKATEKAAQVEAEKSEEYARDPAAALDKARPEAAAKLLRSWRVIRGHSACMAILIIVTCLIVLPAMWLVGQAMYCEGSVSFWAQTCEEGYLASNGTNVTYG